MKPFIYILIYFLFDYDCTGREVWKVRRVDAGEPFGGYSSCPDTKCWCSGSREVSMDIDGRDALRMVG